MSPDPLANGRGRWLAIAASIAVAAAIFHVQGTEHPCCLPAATAPGQGTAPVRATPKNDATPAAELVAASAPVASREVPFALPPGVAPEDGLQIH
ncbi:MAG: glycoside hydrolase, partial [Mycobacterium sp.]